MKIDRRYPWAAGSISGCLLMSVMPYDAAVAAWDSVSDISMGIEANDNPRLGQDSDADNPATADEHTALRALMDARIDLSNSGPRGQFLLQPRVRLDTYADTVDEDLEREDLYLNARGAYQWERTEAGLRTYLSRESILSSELLDVGIEPDDIEEPIDTDTGRLILLDEHRSRAIIAPYASFEISERSNISLDARYLDVTYSGEQLRGRSDFTDTSFGIGVGRTIDDRTRASARIVAATFEADATDNTTDTVGVEGTIERTLNATWTFDLTTGLQRSEFTFLDTEGEIVDNATTSFTLNLGFRKRTDIATLDLRLQRLVSPNAVGFLAERNEFRVFYSRQMSERLTGTLAFRAMDSGALDNPQRGNDREFARLELDLDWALTRYWSLNVGYGAVHQEFTGQREGGNANLVSLGFNYRGLSSREE